MYTLMLESSFHDVRYAARLLLRRPGVATVAVGVLALGLGVNTAVLAVAHGVFWRPLPYPDASRLVTVTEVYEEGGVEHGARLAQIDEWNRRLRTIRVAGHHTRERAVRGAGQARVLEVATVTGGFFEVVGVPAWQGAVPDLAAGDTRAVISTELAGMLDTETDRPVLGQALTIGNRGYEVAAVMPAGFAFPSADTGVWLATPRPAPEGSASYRLVGRLRDRATFTQAREDATRVAREINGEAWNARVESIEEALYGELRPVLRTSIAAALLVLVAACANAVTLLVGRSLVRSEEFTVRMALGCGLARVVRAALAEGLVVAGGGLVLGLVLAWAGLRLFAALAAGVLPRVDVVALDAPVLFAGSALTLLVAAACGGASAAGAVRRDGSALLRGVAAAGSRNAVRLREGLAAGQIALSVVLLIGAGLLARSVDRLLNEESGFEPRRALTARLMLADTPFVEGGAATAFVNTLLNRVRGLPGVQAAGIGSMLPPADAPLKISFVRTPEHTGDSRTGAITLSFGAVTAGYFAALGTPWREGRRFAASDDLSTASPVILSETAARFLLHPDEAPVGRPMPWDLDAFGIARGDSPVVAIVGDTKYQGLDAPQVGSVYVPWRRAPTGVSHLVVRTTNDPLALAPAIRDLVRTLNPALPVPEMRTLAGHAAGSISDRRLRLVPAAGFAGLALAVALTGLFGTLARTVAERRRELAVRAAVGASPGRLLRVVLRNGLAVTGVGLAAGLAGAAAAGRGLAGLLYGVSPYDPLTFGVAAAVVVLAALAASAPPARRAARLDPMSALRAE